MKIKIAVRDIIQCLSKKSLRKLERKIWYSDWSGENKSVLKLWNDLHLAFYRALTKNKD